MTSIAQLAAALEGRGIGLFLEGGTLRYRSPKNALTQEDRAILRARKAEIAAWLAARDAGRALKNAPPRSGPLTPAMVQEMWWRFAGMPEEGKPFPLNIGMAGTFRDAGPAEVTRAIRALLARHEALRVGFRADGEALFASAAPVESLVIEQEDLTGLAPETARAAAEKSAQQFCGRLNPILGDWLTRAKVIALPEGAMAVISSAHMIADAGTRNIVIDQLHDLLQGRPLPDAVAFNDFSLAERAFFDTPQGESLIGYWRDWYRAQPTMRAPADGAPLLWGAGTRIVRNFNIPGRVLARARGLARQMKVTPFLVYLAIFAIAMARWSGLERFPVRVLGDKRTRPDLTATVGLMFCADAVDIHAPETADFETVLRGILRAYDAALARRIPTLHFYAPHMVRPGIEPIAFPNRIPAVFNYYSVGTEREKAEAGPDRSADWPWPPQVTELPPQSWPRVSSPLFLHLMDYGAHASASLHFFADVLGDRDRDGFAAALFAVFDEILPP